MRKFRQWKVGKLTAFISGFEDVLLIDWRKHEPHKRWRIQLGLDHHWMIRSNPPATNRGKIGRVCWAYWGIGNEGFPPIIQIRNIQK